MRAALWIVAVIAGLFAAERILKMVEMIGEPFAGVTFAVAGPAAATYTLVAVVAATAAIVLGRLPQRVEESVAPEAQPPAPAPRERCCAACGAPLESWRSQCTVCGCGVVVKA
jgi:hypothetical protein